MNEYLQSILLGIVEGLTEFLPVSSTAHLRIAEAWMRIPLDDPYWTMYTVVIQLGAILALCALFLNRILDFVRTFPGGDNGDRRWWNHPISMTALAFVFTVIPYKLMQKWSEANLGSLTAMALALLVGGIVMWAVDLWATRRDDRTSDVEQMGLGQSIWIGLCQSLAAIFPGTSRSMATIAAGQIAGMSRPAALEFSFLLSIPTMLAATVWDLKKEVIGSHGAAAQVTMTGHRWAILLIGLVVSFVVAWGVVEWFLAWVRRHGFTLFALYRILLGIALLAFGSRLLAG